MLLADRYQLGQPLGCGGAAEVFRARDLQRERDVAVKLWRSSALAAPAALRRFEREAGALARLEHPNVVRLFDSGRVGTEVFMVLELVPGGTLAERLEAQGPLPWTEVVELGIKLADALGHAHGRGLLHRDVKPANVLIDPGGGPKLTDFGLTRDLEVEPGEAGYSVTQPGRFLGTPGYCPPEQAYGELERLGPWSDTFGLAATLYAALTGQAPGGKSETMLAFIRSLQSPPVPPSKLVPEVPAWLDDVLLAALRADPEVRTRGPLELAQGLAHGELGAEVAGSLFRSAEQASSVDWSRSVAPGPELRSPSFVAVAALVLLLASLLGGAAAYTFAWSAPSSPSPLVEATPPGPASAARLAADRSLIVAARRAQREHNLLLADELLSRFLRHQEDFEARLLRAEVRDQLAESGPAVADLNLALAERPDSVEALRLRALQYLRLGDSSAAMADYQRALKLDPEAVDVLSDLGVAYYTSGQGAAAVPVLKRVTSLDPSGWKGWLRLGQALLMRQDYPAAEEALLRSLEREPDNPTALVSLAWAKAYQDEDQASADFAEQALRLDPLSGSALLIRAKSLFELGHYSMALDCYETAAERGKQADVTDHALQYAAVLESLQGPSPEEGTKRELKRLQLWAGLWRVAGRAGQALPAVEDRLSRVFEQGLALERSSLLMNLGRYQESKAQLLKLGDHPLVLKELGRVCKRQGKYEEALEYLRAVRARLLERRPGDGHHLTVDFFIGDLLVELKRYQEAEPFLLNAEEASPNHPLIKAERAYALQGLGDHAGALALLRAAAAKLRVSSLNLPERRQILQAYLEASRRVQAARGGSEPK